MKAKYSFMESKWVNESDKLLVKIFERILSTNPTSTHKEGEEPSTIFLIGLAVWDIFSNNNDVINKEGKCMDIGSWRGSGTTIANIIHHHFNQSGKENYDYLDFYMGSEYLLKEDTGTMKEFYKEIFTILKELEYEWKYDINNKWINADLSLKAPEVIIAYKQIYGRLPDRVG